MTFDELTVGSSVEATRLVDDALVQAFAEVSQDFNPVHLDEAFAAKSRFGGRIAHGMLAGAMISALIASRLPGPGSVYLRQEMKFMRPVMVGGVLRTQLTVTDIDHARRRVRLATRCFNEANEILVDGEALVWVPEP